MTELRIASTSDAEPMLDIYRHYVLNTATSFETQLPSPQQFAKRITGCLEKYPWFVCLIDGKLAGYAYASNHREREAYQWTCECSVYVHDDFRGRGIGLKLYEVLFETLKLQGFRNVYAGITKPNDASEKLHQKCGFELFALYEKVGFKLGKWHNVGWWKLQMNGYDLKPPPPQKFAQIDLSSLTLLFEEAAMQIDRRLIQ